MGEDCTWAVRDFHQVERVGAGWGDSPGKWVMFDDQFFTRMGEIESGGFGAIMEVPFYAQVNSCRKSFVDDKSYMMRNHARLVQSFVWAEKSNGSTGTEMKPPKGGV